MGAFWDARAKENALYFVDNTLDYGSPDAERFWREGQVALQHILDALGVELSPDDDVVEIGCGVGRITRALAAQARSVTAVDVSAEMLARAKAWTPDADNVHWVHGDGSSLAPVPEASVTACFSHVTFQHVPDPTITLGYVREMARVLKPGGWSAFQVSNDPSIHRRRGGAATLGARVRALAGRAPRGQDHPAWRGSAVDLPALRAAAELAGLSVARIEGAGTQFCLVLLRRPA